MKLQNQLKTQERFANHEYYGGLSTRLNASHVAQFVCKMRASLWAAERVYKGMEAKVGGVGNGCPDDDAHKHIATCGHATACARQNPSRRDR